MPSGHLTKSDPGEYRQGRPGTVWITAGVDTEGSVEHPWCVSWSTEPGFGMVDRTMATEFTGLAVLHNALHDLPLVHVQRFTDTMLIANLLGVEPHGLKPLARRHCGMLMQDYDSVVRDARQQKALEYLATVLDYAETISITKD